MLILYVQKAARQINVMYKCAEFVILYKYIEIYMQIKNYKQTNICVMSGVELNTYKPWVVIGKIHILLKINQGFQLIMVGKKDISNITILHINVIFPLIFGMGSTLSTLSHSQCAVVSTNIVVPKLIL